MSTVIHLCGKVIASVFSSCKILPAPVEKRGLREGWEDNPTPWRNLLGAGGGVTRVLPSTDKRLQASLPPAGTPLGPHLPVSSPLPGDSVLGSSPDLPPPWASPCLLGQVSALSNTLRARSAAPSKQSLSLQFYIYSCASSTPWAPHRRASSPISGARHCSVSHDSRLKESMENLGLYNCLV